MHLADSSSDRHDVLGIGNAIVDILAYAEDDLVEELGLARGAMTLIDAERSEFLYRRLGPAREVSGGSCANTIAAVASLGGRGAYIGRVRDDQLGRVFAHDIRAAGVTFRSPPSPNGPATATSMIFVAPDGQRTMNTYLGACVELGPGRCRPRSRGRRRDHLSRGLSVGPAGGQGRLPQGRHDLPRRRPAAGADPVGRVLRRSLAGRVPRAGRARGRHPVRERERDHQPLRGRATSTGAAGRSAGMSASRRSPAAPRARSWCAATRCT